MSVKVHEAFCLDSARRFFLFEDHFLGDSLRDLWAVNGTGSAVVVDAQDGGIVRITTGALDTNLYYLHWGDYRSLLASKKVTMEFRLRINNVDAINSELALYFDASNRIEFVEVAGNWSIRCENAGADTILASGVALDTDWHIYRIECLPTGEVHFYIDDVETGNSPITTNIPIAYLQPRLGVQTTEDVAKTMDFDYVVCRQER